MVKVCDRCRKPAVIHELTIATKFFDLCEPCEKEVIRFIEHKPNNSFFENLRDSL